jgi:hypothetical protein
MRLKEISRKSQINYGAANGKRFEGNLIFAECCSRERENISQCIKISM